MKILIANWVYNWGSTGYLVRDLVDELAYMGHHVIAATAVMHGEDSRVYVFMKPKEWGFFWRLGHIGLPRLSGSKTSARRLIALIEEQKPDIVNLHLLHCHTIDLYYLLRYLGKHNIKTVLTNHAEIYYTGNCEHAYNCCRWIECQCTGCKDKRRATGSFLFGNPHQNWLKMKQAMDYFKPENLYLTAVSPWMKERIGQSPITKGFECKTVLNGLNIRIFSRRYNIEWIHERIGREGFLLHVTAKFEPKDKDDVKGSYYLVKLAEIMPDMQFVVVATSVGDTDGLPPNISVWGKAKDQDELAELYSAAQLSVLVSRRETYSMVTAESLCCGTPVVGFKAGGPESIAIPSASEFVEQRDVEGLSRSIRNMLGSNFDRIAISEEAREKYNPVMMAKGYLETYEKVIAL